MIALTRLTSPAIAAALVAVVFTVVLLGAWGFQYLGGLAPCPLCLLQRWPYYIGIPLAAAVALAAGMNAPRWVIIGGLAALALVLIASVAFGAFHAGVEWRLWPGPDCTATQNPSTFRAGDLMAQMRQQRIVLCDEAAWRFAGISLAGYNALISLALFVLVLIAGRRMLRGAEAR